MENIVIKDWGEKYRPSSINDIIIHQELKTRFETFLKNGGGVALLLHGKPGIGKTSIARAISRGSSYFMNCADQNSVKDMRHLDRICSSVSLDGRRLIILDEGEHLTKEAQVILRGVIDKHQSINDFVMTANEVDKVSEAIRSRLIPICLNTPWSQAIQNSVKFRLQKILELENITSVDDMVLNQIIKRHQPDIRAIVKYLQFHVQN